MYEIVLKYRLKYNFKVFYWHFICFVLANANHCWLFAKIRLWLPGILNSYKKGGKKGAIRRKMILLYS